MNDFLWDVILGRGFLRQNEFVSFNFGGSKSLLHVHALQTNKNVSKVHLFEHMTPDSQPTAASSRKFTKADEEFIKSWISQQLKDSIIEPSSSPWHDQVVITKSDSDKKRLHIDYSHTVNKFTALNVYPSPTIRNVINNEA